MRRVFRRLIRRVNTTEWSVSWFEVLPGEDPTALSAAFEADARVEDLSTEDIDRNEQDQGVLPAGKD